LIINNEDVEKRRPGRPRKETQSTEHIVISPELKAGLETLRGIKGKNSIKDVILMLFQSYLFTLRASAFLRTLAELNKKENESMSQACDRMLKYKPAKIELEKEARWVGADMDMKTIQTFFHASTA
jgi:predicted CopG family antitoxin